MPSIRAKIFNSLVRFRLKRRRWGRTEAEFTQRTRSLFGTPWLLQKLAVVGLDVVRVDEKNFSGEWISSRPPSSAKVLLYVHGGGFVACSAAEHRPITAGLARRTGLPVFAVEYRRAPEHRYPSALDDVVAAYQYLSQSSDVVVAGDSAGGGLVLSLLVHIRDQGLRPARCAICFSPWADLTPRPSDCRNADCDDMFFPENMEEFADVYLGESSPLEPLASPAFADLSGLPPVLVQVGSSEILLEDARLVHEKIVSAGGSSRLDVFDVVAHCWQMATPFVPEASRALDEATQFIRDNRSRPFEARGVKKCGTDR